MKYIIPIIILSLILFGCKAAEDDSTSSTTELEGEWKTACYTKTDNLSYVDTLTFADSTVTVKEKKHSDTSCATDYRRDKSSNTFALEEKGKIIVTQSSTFSKKPLSSTAVTNYNNSSKCGQSDWELNTSKDCTNSDGGSKLYVLYEISGDTLYTAAQGSSYPTSITKDTANTFTKQ